jgi:hypothetical protein
MIELKAADLQAPPSIAALQNKALGIGLVGMAASIAGYLFDPRAATESACWRSSTGSPSRSARSA